MDGVAPDNSVTEVLPGGGELGALMRARDWAKTPLGPVKTWPQSLRSLLSMLLPSKAQIILFWGPEFIVFYNDAYRPVFGAKHPHALGLPGRDAWSEIWDTILHELLAGVVRTGEAFWAQDLLFMLERHGFLEETYFDVSYDPVRVESGGVGGVYCIVTETTDRVVGARRMALLKDLAARQTTARTTHEAYALAMELLATRLQDIAFALAYEGEDLQSCTPDAHARLASADPDLVRELPVLVPGFEGRASRLVVGLNAQRPFDDQYRQFLELVASQLGTALANACAYEEERKRAEALAEIDRAKTAFFSNVSHEFRTPLTLILGPVEDMVTESADRPPAERDRIDLVHRNSLRLLKLVNTLLDFSRIEAGRVQAVFEPTDLSTLTADLASAFRSAVERAGMELVVDCPPLREPVYVDRDMWEKIVLNLVSNAFKYTLSGRITVSLQPMSNSIVLAVTDTGVGIPEKEQAHVFERFHRVEGIQGRTHEGTGIGLALVHELAKLHGGSVSVVSQPGAGSTFTVTISKGTAHLPGDRISAARTLAATTLGATPYVEEALRWLPQKTRETGASSDVIDMVVTAATPRTVRRETAAAHVILADDNADMRDYVSRLLSGQYDVAAVPDGLAALAAARSRRPDLILADVMMPLLDGFGLLRELRRDPDLSGVPVVLLSARAGEEARVEGWGAGADDYLVKPFSARELLARVESHLSLAQVRREGEAALRESERRFRALVMASSDAVYRMNADWSEMRYLEGRDFMPDTREASRSWLTTYIAPEDQLQVLDVIREAIRTKSVFQLEHRVRRVDGTLGWAFSRAIPVLEGGEIVEWFGTATDVSERKQIEQALQQSLTAEQHARTEAQRASRMKDEFLTMLSHELRTPLNAILGWSQVIARTTKPTPDGVSHGLEAIERNARLQAQLIEDLLDVSRITEGKLRLDVKQVALCEVVEAALASIQPAADAKQIKVQTMLDRQSDQVNGDPARLQQVVWNLLSNAVKFTSKGGRIQVLVERANSHVALSVSDNGEGIAQEFQPYVFDRFRQADQSSTRAFGGLGLGLSIVKHLVELHGGTVRVKSAGKGEGTSFIVELPLRLQRHFESAGENERAAESLVALSTGDTRLDGVTVLYVDDEPDSRDLAQRVLSDQGARVITAESAAVGRRLMAKEHPDVLVADIGMPDEDGYSLIRTIRSLPAERGGAIPAAAVTALARSEDRRRALLAGFQTHVAKPVDVVELVAVVASLAGRTGRH
jgi:signal transduction histidine kinase